MTDFGRVVTAKLPDELIALMDEVSGRIERSKSWIVREAVSHWLIEEQRRHDLTLEALQDIDEGRTVSHDDLKSWAEKTKNDERSKSAT